MAGKARPDGILVPKISSVEDLKADRRSPRRHQRRSVDQGLGDDRDRARGAACRGTRRRLARSRRRGWPASCSGRTTSRGRRGSACMPGRAAMIPMITHCILADPRSRPRNSRRALQRFQQCRRLRPGMRAGPRSRLRRQDADPSRPDRGLQRDLHAAARRKSHRPARSSRRSSSRRTPRAARSSSTARWWSGCTPRWPGAPLQSRTRSRRWGVVMRVPSPCGRG